MCHITITITRYEPEVPLFVKVLTVALWGFTCGLFVEAALTGKFNWPF